MTAQVAAIMEQVSTLTPEERAELADALARLDAADDAESQAEIQHRIADYRSGAIKPVSFETAVSEIRDRLAARRARRQG
jgi:putative addiction module component (TIGR02574 family)